MALACGALTLTAATTLTAVTPSQVHAATAVNVTVNADEGLGTLPDTAYGLNSAVWDSQMNVPQVQDLLQQAGVQMLRYPGGSYGDIYNWQDNTAPGGYVAPGTDFDSFMGTVKKIGAQPILIANYGSGTPQEAADWVRYANVTKGYGDKYWEIGNEIYGNGYYGSDWETDDHASKSPATYASNLLQYADAMKAVDPAIKIGAVLTLPGNWPDGATDYGDEGLLSSGTCVGSVCEPALNTPFPSYYAISMLSKLGQPGDTMVAAGTDNQLVSAHAVRNANGDLSVMLINKDPVNSYSVSLHYAGFTPSAEAPAVYTYGDEASAITTGTGLSTVPPYSIVTVVLTPQPGSQSSLTAPGSPSVSAVTDTSATVSWSPSSGGTVDKYAIYKQFGTDSELLGTSAGTSFTVSNLVPGTGYTLNVLAIDSRGYLSPPSVPVTFTTGTPATSTCAVTYDVTDGWSSGFVTNISITDTGLAPVNGWTLAFSFPADTESVSSSNWNANWSESGQNVVATNVDWDGYLAPSGGNSYSIGFVANQSGAYPSPASFTLNGTVCTTTYSS